MRQQQLLTSGLSVHNILLDAASEDSYVMLGSGPTRLLFRKTQKRNFIRKAAYRNYSTVVTGQMPLERLNVKLHSTDHDKIH